MINFTKRLLSNSSVTRGLAFVRFPWSLVSVPLILLGWYHFSGQPQNQSRTVRVQTADMRGDSRHRAEVSRQIRGDARGPEIVVTSGSDAAIESDADGMGLTDDPGGIRDAESRCRRKAIGEWQDDYQGKRHLTVNEDGSGTMVVDLDGIGKKIFAARLAFDLEWNVADGHISMKTLGGEPKAKVQMVLKLYGNEAEYKILELTDERMLLLDADGKTKYDWRRPGAKTAE